jgi:hypothetical protein
LEELVWPESKTLVHDMVRNKEMDALASTRSTVFSTKNGEFSRKKWRKSKNIWEFTRIFFSKNWE